MRGLWSRNPATLVWEVQESLGYISKVEVSPNFLENYQKKIKGAKNSNEENSFAINDFINVYDKAYIAGSTVKGAIKSAYLYYLGDSKKIFNYKVVKDFKGRKDWNNDFNKRNW